MSTLASAFLGYVETAPTAPALYARDLAGDGIRLSREDLAREVARCARWLVGQGLAPGGRVVLALENSLEFVVHFWATLLAGGVAVPCPPPGDRGRRREASLGALGRICQRAEAAILVAEAAADVRAAAPGARVLEAHDYRASDARAFAPRDRSGDDLAVIQFTSGSTTDPKGCALAHAAMLANAQALVARCGVEPGDTGVGWLPLHHDMGLMSCVVTPVVGGAASSLLSPARFLANPLCWLRELAAHDRTHTAAPNFALALTLPVVERRRADLAALNLRPVVSLMCGAEPIDAAVVRRFLHALAPFRLSPDCFHAAYGMSETTVMAASRPGGLTADRVDALALQDERVARCVPAGPACLDIVNLGTAAPGAEIRIVGGEGQILEPRHVGHVQVRGPSLMRGYFGDETATQAAMSGSWLQTGDLGYLAGGDLHITGRSKDQIIVAGRNIAPSDVEHRAASEPDLAGVRLAVFGAEGARGTEEIYVVAEVRGRPDQPRVRQGVDSACYGATGLFPARVFIVPRGAVPRTTSGKPQRGVLREMLRRGELTNLSEAQP